MRFVYKVIALTLMICFYISAYAEDTHNQSQVQQQPELGISEELDRLEAQISKQQDEYRKSPRRKFIGSRTKEKRYATYVDEWWRKVQDVGSLNYPQAAKNLGLSGTLQLTVSILPDGAIERIEINRSSGNKILDDAAVDITKLASPFAPFSDEMKKDIDLLSITRNWTFTH